MRLNKRCGLDMRFRHVRAGEVIWDSGWRPNQFTNDGIEDMLSCYFEGATEPAKFQLALYKTTNPTKDSTITFLDTREVTGTDYARQDLAQSDADWDAEGEESGQQYLRSKSVTFGPAGASDWDTTIGVCLVADQSTDVLVAWDPLGTSRTLTEDDTLAVTFKIKRQDP